MDLGLGSLIAGGISAVGSLFGSSQGSKQALQAVRETNQANKELAEYSYEKNLEMWNRQNEYNSPIEQMERLKAAGLNPNLMYDQGNTGNASNAPQYDAPNLQSYTGFGDYGASNAANNLLQGVKGYVDVKKTEAEIDAIRQNTKNMEIQGQGINLRNLYQVLMNDSQGIKNQYLVDLIRSQISNLDSQTINNFSSSDLRKAQTSFTSAQENRFNILTPLVKEQVEIGIKQSLFNYLHLSPAKLNNILSDTKLKQATAKLTDFNSKVLFNELEFGEKSASWNMYKREFDAISMEFEKTLQQTLIRNGINLKSGNWFNPLLYDIEKYIALPLEELLNN